MSGSATDRMAGRVGQSVIKACSSLSFCLQPSSSLFTHLPEMKVSLPETIRALRIQDDKTVAVVTLPFAPQERVRDLPSSQVLVCT